MLNLQIDYQTAAIMADSALGPYAQGDALAQLRADTKLPGPFTLIDPDGDVVAVLGGES